MFGSPSSAHFGHGGCAPPPSGAPPSTMINVQNNDQDEEVQPSLTIVERDGVTLLESQLPSDTTPASIAPQAGDSTDPNNYLPMGQSNAFVCPCLLTLGSSTNQTLQPLPDKVSLTVMMGRERVMYDLQVTFTNPLTEVCSALLTIPHLPDVLLLEEAHTCGTISYQTGVEELEKATQKYQQAAASSTHTATLSSTESAVHHVQMDKVPADASATFRLRFLQAGGLKCRQKVLSAKDLTADVGAASSSNKQYIADLAVVPGYTGLDGAATGSVPFELKVLLESGLRVELPEEEVLRHNLSKLSKQGSQSSHSRFSFGGFEVEFGVKRHDILSVVQLGSTLVHHVTTDNHDKSHSKSWLAWKSITGLARGTLLKLRVVHTQRQSQQISQETPSSPSQFQQTNDNDTSHGIISYFDTMEGIINHEDSPTPPLQQQQQQKRGARCDSTLIEIDVPLSLPPQLRQQQPNGFLKNRTQQQKHHVYMIVDTSGSTSMHTSSGMTFLETSKLLLNGILEKFPNQVAALRGENALGVSLWSFNSDVRIEVSNFSFRQDAFGGSSSTLPQPLQMKVQALQSNGFTNYDAWAEQLKADVLQHPTDLHSVLLVTDGGATHRSSFFDTIQSIVEICNDDGFFQVDCLGYGPWLDPECVSFLSDVTGGEALMVESLADECITQRGISSTITTSITQQWATGILARSLLRAASSRLCLKITGGSLLAVADVGNPTNISNGGDHTIKKKPPSAAYSCCPFSQTKGPVTTVSITAGQKIQLVVLHESGVFPSLSLTLQQQKQRQQQQKSGDDIELSWPSKLTDTVIEKQQHQNTVDILDHWPTSKLADPLTMQTLRHLMLLEPAFCCSGGVNHPAFSIDDRTAVTLATSIRGQVLSPSVTKGVAVASLDDQLTPVPKMCRPKPAPTLWQGSGSNSAATSSVAQQQPPKVVFQDEKTSSAHPPTVFGGFCGTAPPFGCSPASLYPPSGGLFGAPAPSAGSSFGSPSPSTSYGAQALSTSSPFGTAAMPFYDNKSVAWSLNESVASISQQQGEGVGSTPPILPPVPPNIVTWIRDTRGGLYPTEHIRMNNISKINCIRLTRTALAKQLDTVSSDITVRNALRLIECAICLFPNIADVPLFEKWALDQLSSKALQPILPALRLAAKLCGAQHTTNAAVAQMAEDVWPWQEDGTLGPGHCATSVSDQDVMMRRREQDLFTAAVRRDIYSILRNPHHPQTGATGGLSPSSNIFPMSALLAKLSSHDRSKNDEEGISPASYETFVFFDRSKLLGENCFCGKYKLLDDDTMLDAVTHIGCVNNPASVAVTCAFEDYLSKLVAEYWGDGEVACLSIEFLLAFGREMSNLGIYHRIRCTKLTPEELAHLKVPRFAQYVDQNVLRLFQG